MTLGWTAASRSRFSRIRTFDAPVKTPVRVLVDDLQVEEEQVGLAGDVEQRPGVGRGRRCQRRRGCPTPRHGARRLQQERRLQERLAARERDAAARLVVEDPVALDSRHQRVDGRSPARPARGRPWDRRPAHAPHVVQTVGRDGVGDGGRHAPRGAGRRAVQARQRDAALGLRHELGLEPLALGAVAPGAAERAALEEHGRPDAGAVVDRESLDAQNRALDHRDPLAAVVRIAARVISSTAGHLTTLRLTT